MLKIVNGAYVPIGTTKVDSMTQTDILRFVQVTYGFVLFVF